MLVVMGSNPNVWRSRIVGHDRVDPTSLVANPHNFRTHPIQQRDALGAAIAEVGFVRSVMVNKTTGNLVDGHERVWQALHTEQHEIDVEYVELTEEEERKVIASLDHIGSMAVVDDTLLNGLLSDMETDSVGFQRLIDEMGVEVENGDTPADFTPYEGGQEDPKTSKCPQCGCEF